MRALFVILLVGCAAPPPYACSTPVDSSGRGLALCHDPMSTPVCDAPGGVAHYESDAMGGTTLVDGTIANCDASNQVVCADRTVLPHCVPQP